MKKYIRRKAAAAFIALAFLIVFPMEALAEQGGTTFGIEQYGQDTNCRRQLRNYAVRLVFQDLFDIDVLIFLHPYVPPVRLNPGCRQ